MSQSKETFMADREREQNALPIIYAGMSKTDISIAAKSAVDNLLENGNTLQIAEQIAALETFLKEVKADDRYAKAVRDEVEKYGKVYTAGSGAKIEVAEVGTKYDFSQCNDPILYQFEQRLQGAEEAVKQRKEFLKTVPLSGMDIITEDGEPVKVYPPSKSSKSSFKIELKK
jgi:hypothetical protein